MKNGRRNLIIVQCLSNPSLILEGKASEFIYYRGSNQENYEEYLQNSKFSDYRSVNNSSKGSYYKKSSSKSNQKLNPQKTFRKKMSKLY